KARRVELAIELGKFQPIPPPGKRRQASRLAGVPAAKAPPGIARPGAVIDRPRGRLAELAVIDYVDADFGLLAAYLLDGGGQRCRKDARIVGLSGKLGSIEVNQPIGPRQATNMRGEYP